MSKATELNTPIPTRRALLTGAPAVAAGALLAGTAVNLAAVTMAKADGSDADAELLSLKPEFDDVSNEWIRQTTKDCVEHQEWERRHLATFGFKRSERNELELNWSVAERASYNRAVGELIDELHAGKSEDELELVHWDRINDKINPLAGEILSYTASTLDGLRLQTRALLIYENQIWSPALHDAEPEGPMCDFFASLCGVLGVPFPPVPERWQS